MKLTTKSGNDLHPIGIGTWDIASRRNEYLKNGAYGLVEAVYGNEDSEIEAIRYSISKGQNHIDCAEMYGAFYTDEVVGRTIDGIDREELFIADKLWKTSLSNGSVRKTVEKMLNKLGTTYLDMLYIHAPWLDVPWHEAIPQINELIDAGLVKHFAVSNFTIKDMKKASELSKHPITANQMNFNVLHKDEVNLEFIDYCSQNKIQIIAYQPIKRGEVNQNNLIKKIAANHSATPAQISLAWLTSQNILTIPKAIRKEHIDENLKSIDIVLTPDEIELLNSI